MSVVNTGTTNFDGTGSASNLDSNNAASTLNDTGILQADDALLENVAFSDDSTTTIVSSEEWNGVNTKEAQVNNDAEIVIVDNFVDVDVDNTNEEGVDIIVKNAKRGNIDTANGDDTVDISVFTNNEGWVNKFEINTNDGDDSVTLTNAQNSQFTSLDINLGTGNDTVDVSDLVDPYSGASRAVDGGEGTDTLVFSGDNTVSFENCEVIIGGKDAGLNVDSDLLASNDESGFGLVLSDIDVTFDADVVYDTAALSADEATYLTSQGLDSDNFSSLTVTADDGETYHVLTDDADFAVA